ncbi:sensor histidine kinase [Mucilaginibacter aquaedulcis]|jgi:two-component system LytT family sensor kinase|uniref:sensor histidine kinase n=1 Tax=Mucilaginibacter aquaedulcis TaxID=1187081 RepID=UPI0025B5F74F|nr:sensor histidine kinase [Mucilaginibacter aquaedulcis]MDN3551643.1 sensor histidine kinase [Mucilaginibacter aquaedulcis]
MAFSSLKKIFFSVHFYIVTCLFALMLFPLSWPIRLPGEFWVKQVLVHMVWAALFYSNMLFFTPKLLYKNRVVVFVLLMIALLVLMVYLNNWLDDVTGCKAAMGKLFKNLGKKSSGDDHSYNYWTIISALVILGVSTIIAVSKKIKADQAVFQATQQEKISSELSFLRAQINPHFFFNILHTIYALSDSNPAAAKDAVYTLSHMMRYVIYENKNNLTSLEKEIKFVEDYIKLMKLRLSDDVQIIFEKQADLKNHEVAPMLFLPFIENAFKHGISSVHPSYIYIDISQTADKLKLEIKNSLFEEKSAYLEDSNGIGIVNTKRRLDLLYHGRYTLSVERNEAAREFTVVLIFDFK